MIYTLNNFYQSKAWRALLEVIKMERVNDQGEIICAHCGEPITRKYDCIGHHVVPLNERNVNDAAVSLNPDNVVLVHHVCHNRIHNKLGHIVRQVYLVWGSPLAGKSSYVHEVAEYGDLIIDIDNIWQCVSGQQRYVKPDRLKPVVFGIRDTLLDMVRHRCGTWRNAYVIGGYPLVNERERLIKRLGARDVYISASYEECLARLKCCKDGRNVREWKSFLDDWWKKSKIGPPPSP